MKRGNDSRNRPHTFEEKLKEFMKKSNTKQEEISRRENRSKRNTHKKKSAPREENT